MKKGLDKLIAGIILSVAAIFSLTGCFEAYKNRQLTDSEKKFQKNYKTRPLIQVPGSMEGTMMDPFPPARRGYDQLKLIN